MVRVAGLTDMGHCDYQSDYENASERRCGSLSQIEEEEEEEVVEEDKWIMRIQSIKT